MAQPADSNRRTNSMRIVQAFHAVARTLTPTALAALALFPLAAAQGQTPPKYSVKNLGTLVTSSDAVQIKSSGVSSGQAAGVSGTSLAGPVSANMTVNRP